VMREGRVEQLGTPREVYEAPLVVKLGLMGVVATAAVALIAILRRGARARA